MRTTIDLLIRLQELRRLQEAARRNPQLTDGEKAAICSLKSLVRDCLPQEVLRHYDRLRRTESALLKCPEVFAMAVLVSTYRCLSPRQRQRLAKRFATPPRVRSGCNGQITTRHAGLVRHGLRSTRRQSWILN